jgi:hypothetical protein
MKKEAMQIGKVPTTQDTHLIKIQRHQERTAAACGISRSLVQKLRKREQGSYRRQLRSILLFQHTQEV